MVTPAVKLLWPLGAGGMGAVWVAEHTGLKTEVVVKFMAVSDEDRAEATERFAREAALSAAVKSPHVVQVFDHGTTPDGLLYIIMELLDGHDLATHLDKYGAMSPKDVAAMIAQVAKGLGKAHQAGVIHRDIKPDNIFLCDGEGGELFVKLLDFGIAKSQERVTGSNTTTGQVVGTPYYMSPEQIVGEKTLDARTDIWSLGVVAFEAITGHRPFEGATVGAITLSIHKHRPRMTAIKPELPATLDAWFEKVCAQEPADRFATAREAANALLEAVGDAPGPTLVRPPAMSLLVESSPSLEAQRPPPSRPETSLSAAFPVSGVPKRRGPVAIVVATVAVAAVLAVVAVVVKRPSATTTPIAEPTRAAATSADPRAIPPPVDPPPSAAAATPSSASASPSSSAASATSAATVVAKPNTMVGTPGVRPAATTRPTTTARPRKPNDDDIK